MILCEKQVHIPANIGMRRIKGNIKTTELPKTGKTSKSYNFQKPRNSLSSYRGSSPLKQSESKVQRRKSLDTQETWTVLNGSRNINNGDLCNTLNRKKDGRVFPQIKTQSRSKSSNNLFELISHDKHTFANNGFLTERRTSNQTFVRRQSIATPREVKQKRSISVDSRPFTSHNNHNRSTSSQKSGQSFTGSYQDKYSKLNSISSDVAQRPQSRDSYTGLARPRHTENLSPLSKNNSNKSLSTHNWAHNIRDDVESPVPLKITSRPLSSLIKPDPNFLLLTHRASSVKSPSSNDSLSATSFSMKLAGRRRLSLPATSGPLLLPMTLDLGKSPEYSRAFQDLQGKTKKNLSDYNDNSNRAQTSSPNNRRDSLQRIEEIPYETSALKLNINKENNIPVIAEIAACSNNENGRNDVKLAEAQHHLNNAKNKGLSSTIVNKTDLIFEENAENYPHLREPSDIPKKSLFHFDANDIKRRNSSHLKKEEEISNREKNIFMVHGIADENSTDSVDENDTNGWANHQSFTLDEALVNLATPHFKNHILWEVGDFSSNSSIIDLSIVNDENDAMEDYLFRRKRIIMWLMAAETGERAETVLSSKIVSTSPPCGTKATAIKVVYNEDDGN